MVLNIVLETQNNHVSAFCVKFLTKHTVVPLAICSQNLAAGRLSTVGGLVVGITGLRRPFAMLISIADIGVPSSAFALLFFR